MSNSEKIGDGYRLVEQYDINPIDVSKKLGYDIVSYLGSGAFGYAYEITGDKVLKIKIKTSLYKVRKSLAKKKKGG